MKTIEIFNIVNTSLLKEVQHELLKEVQHELQKFFFLH